MEILGMEFDDIGKSLGVEKFFVSIGPFYPLYTVENEQDCQEY